MIKSGTWEWWRITGALCLGSIMIFANLYVTQPLMPLLANEFSISPLQASYTLTSATLSLGLSLVFFGVISDALGRRWLILTSSFCAVLTTALVTLVDNYEWLIALRIIQGVCLGGLPAIAVAYMAEEFEPKALVSAIGLYVAANSLGGISGRLLGGFFAEFLSWSHTFGAVAMLSIGLWLILAVLLPKQKHYTAKSFKLKGIGSDLFNHLKNPKLLPAYLLGGFNFFIFVNQFSFITFVLEAEPYHLSTKFLGALFLTYLAGTVASAISGKFGNRFGQPSCMAAGCILLMIGTGITLSESLYLIILGFLISSFGFFFAHSNASSWVSQTATHSKASASSLYLLFYYVGASTGGLYLNIFWQWNAWVGVVIGSLIMLSVTLALALYLKLGTKHAANWGEKMLANSE